MTTGRTKGIQFERDICREWKNKLGNRKGYKGTIPERFWRKVNKRDKKDCWNWKTKAKFGMFWFDGKMEMASRVSMFLHLGKSFSGETYVLHRCDNPRCVNPNHLFLGTHQDNVDDKVSKGRQSRGTHHSEIMKRCTARGEKRGNAKFTNNDIIKIRRLRLKGWSLNKLANHFKSNTGGISRIVNRKAWSHIA